MSLQSGRRLAHYEIVESIGKGGMGEVYRARDTKLGRDVAVKVLPEEFTRDRERLDRFAREARLLAQLNHPNIATLHGLEESDGLQFLVMELVEGETLHERIARGRIPADEAFALFIQIAEGLEAAYAKGIVHRDLKPANIKITPDGIVKILDFGLAKVVVSNEGSRQSESPTVTRGTADGVILGTAPYMSPEQARGKAVDEHTDIWAFGCCLYEALTGRAAFFGETVSDTLARVLETEPDWLRLPATTPPGVRTLLRRALVKDERRRLQHIGDARVELEEALAGEHDVPAPIPNVKLYRMLAIAAGVLAIALLLNVFRRGEDVARPVTRTMLEVAPSESFSVSFPSPSIAISPDGRYVTYVGVGESTEIYLRAIDQFGSTKISGSVGAQAPFFSPDSEWLGFWANGSLMKVSVHGGAPTSIAEIFRPRGASWGSDGMIVFAAHAVGGLWRVAESGVPESLTSPNRANREKSHRLPDVLPGAEAVLFTLVDGDVESFDDAAIALLSLVTGEYRILLVGGTNPRYSPSGHVVYARSGRLWAVPFDIGSLRISGVPVALVEDVAMSNVRSGPAEFGISQSGDLVYAPGGSWGAKLRVAWVDRQGNSDVLVPGPGPFGAPRVSPDGKRIALHSDGANASIWIYDRERTTLTLFASGFNNTHPIWTPDGSRVTFASSADSAAHNLVWKPADGSGASQPISHSELPQQAGSWSPDGTTVAFTTGLTDIWVQTVGSDTNPQPLMAEPYDEQDPMISPDGHWIAYMSNESGQNEVYLRSFPEPGAKFRVSTDGGTRPRWPSSGRELFYRNVDRIMVVDIRESGEPVGRPRVLFEVSDSAKFLANPLTRNYDVAPDGQHFVMIEQTEPQPAPTHLHLVLNWGQELERLVPTGR